MQKFDLTEIELQEQNEKKYEILSYNGCKCKDFYEKNIPFYCKNQYSKQTNKANTAVNNSSDVKGTNSLKTVYLQQLISYEFKILYKIPPNIDKRMNICITLFAFIAIMQQFSVDSNEFSNNGRRIHFQNYFQRMQKRLDPQYFQLGFGKRFIVNDENYPTNMQCCAHKKWLNSKPYLFIAFHLTSDRLQIITLSSELLQIAKQNLLSEESVEITEEYY
ncbi:hypothetical protein T03_15367 [Trichinella britovi]|uniref:Uncharacterized protein n=1 Tax=Trichinella britovi TaxID=45882 RepID=A0A0V1D854_TRIBR|nr:hypothetical protein T03_15367 [Trichinella britovi]